MELDRLYRRRTDELRRVLSQRKPGPFRRLTKIRREATIRRDRVALPGFENMESREI
jgi:hypothetical protein